jgi:hypothetical protein
VAAVAIAENTIFFAVTTKQADRSNGGLHGLQTIAEVMLELRICELALGLVREHRQRHSGYGIQFRPERKAFPSHPSPIAPKPLLPYHLLTTSSPSGLFRPVSPPLLCPPAALA